MRSASQRAYGARPSLRAGIASLATLRSALASHPALTDWLAGFAASLLAYRGIVFNDGDILMDFEWYVPPFKAELLRSVVATLHAWTPSNFGTPDVYPTYFFAIWWHALVALLGANGWLIDRIELVGSFTLAFAGMAGFLRGIAPSATIARLAALGYAGSPFLYAHSATGHLPYMQTYALAPFILTAARAAGRGSRIALLGLFLLFAFVPQPQAMVVLLVAAGVTAFSYGNFVSALRAVCVGLAALCVANAYWLVPAALAWRSTVATLSRLQPVTVQYSLNTSILTRSLLEAATLARYEGSVDLAFHDVPLISAGASLFALVAALALFYRPERSVRRLTIAFTAGAAVSLVLLMGPLGIMRGPVIDLYRHVPAMSLFKENYHFGFSYALALPVLFACGGGALARMTSARIAGIVLALAAALWCVPTLTSGNLGGWGAPTPAAASWPAPAAIVDEEARVLMLPGTSNLHPAGRAVSQDGVDPNLVYSNGIGNWNPMRNIGTAVLHRSFDDRLGELPDIASLAGIRYAYVRDALRSAHLGDNPYLDTATLQARGFALENPVSAAPKLSGWRAVAQTGSALSVKIAATRTTVVLSRLENTRALLLATRGLKAGQGLNIVLRGDAGRRAGEARWFSDREGVWHSAIFRASNPRTVTFSTRTVDRAAPLVVSVQPMRLQRIAVAGATRLGASSQAPVAVEALMQPLQAGCAPPRYSEPLDAVRYPDGSSSLSYVQPRIVVPCAPDGALFRSPVPPHAVELAPTIVVYDGDLTGVAAARAATHDRNSAQSAFVRIDDFWSLHGGERPAVSGIVASAGDQTALRRLDCAGCVLEQPGRTGNLDVSDLGTGWVSADAGSTWVFYFDEFDNESTYRFIVTESAVPYTWKVPCSSGSWRASLAATVTGPAVVQMPGRTVALPPLRYAAGDRRLGMRWYPLGELRCRYGFVNLTIVPRTPALTAVHALLLEPPAHASHGAPDLPAFASYEIVSLPGRLTVVRPIPLALPLGAFGNGVLPETPRPRIGLSVRGTLFRSTAPIALPHERINAAAYRIDAPPTPYSHAVLDVPEAYDARWTLYDVPPDDRRPFWACIVAGACRQVAAPHIEVNGYANGWIVGARARARYYAVFTPEVTFATVGAIEAVFAVIGLAFVAIALLARRRKRAASPTRRAPSSG